MSLFFFQAEDGIRDLVRSRGLGDVYKRQLLEHFLVAAFPPSPELATGPGGFAGVFEGESMAPVSYTHLTLPTSDLV